MQDLTDLLNQVAEGDETAMNPLFEAVYDDLRNLASSKLWQDGSRDIQVTELVNESYIRLVNTDGGMDYECRKHFFGAASEAMRRIIVDSVRKKKALKRGGDRNQLTLNETLFSKSPNPDQILAVNDAIKKLGKLNPMAAQMVTLRFFAGFKQIEAADALGISKDSASDLWMKAKTWLYRELND